MTEVELAQKFINYLSDQYEIYKEVPAGGIIDIVAVSGIIKIGVEVKTSLNFDVLEQAFSNKRFCHYSYAAVPFSPNRSFSLKICEDYGIGLLTWNKRDWKGSGIKEDVKPKFNRSVRTLKLEEWMKRSVAGSQNDRMTAFKVTIENMANHILRYPGCSLSDCLKEVDYHWNTFSSAKSCAYQWIRNGVIKEFTLIDNKLQLTEYGKTKYSR